MLRSRPLTILLLFAASFSLVHAQMDAQQQLIAADRGLLEALAGPSPDIAKYDQALAADYLDIGFGAVHSREEDVAQTKMLRDYTFKYQNPRAVLLSPTSGLVVAEVTYSGLINGFGFQNHILTTTVFSLEHGRWLAHVQMSEPVEALAKASVVPDNDPTLLALRALATAVEADVHIPGYPVLAPPKVMLDGGMRISLYTSADKTVHEAQFADLPEPMQGIWKQWSSDTSDELTGKALFDDMFHRFFFVHELGHWMDSQVIAGLPDSEMRVVAKNEAANKWESETTANRIAVAWYREHDPQYLAMLVSDFRQILSHLPDPVPAGMDKKSYFTNNYQKLGTDPMAYGWYQLQMVVLVYDEPTQSFQQVLDHLPKNRYE